MCYFPEAFLEMCLSVRPTACVPQCPSANAGLHPLTVSVSIWKPAGIHRARDKELHVQYTHYLQYMDSGFASGLQTSSL